MTLKLHLHNPSREPRRGYVTTPWQPIHAETKIPASEVAVFDAYGDQLDTQVHQVDPGDPSRDVLVFWLDHPIRPDAHDSSGVSTAVTVGRRLREMPDRKLKCELDGRDGEYYSATLSNERLTLQFQLAPGPWGDERNWYAGSATTVLLEPQHGEPPVLVKEMLDAFNPLFEDHDQEKRCMQVDRVRFSLSAAAPQPEGEFSPIHSAYRLLSHSAGPVRASVAVASSPFDYTDRDPLTGEERTISYRLHRVVSVYREADFVIDELSVRAEPAGPGAPKPVNLFFNARYFMLMDFGNIGGPSQHRIWDWFAASSNFGETAAFGFATDAHCTHIAQGPGTYPHLGKNHKAFEWELERADVAACLHLFARCGTKGIESRAGKAWFKYIYLPLWAEIAR